MPICAARDFASSTSDGGTDGETPVIASAPSRNSSYAIAATNVESTPPEKAIIAGPASWMICRRPASFSPRETSVVTGEMIARAVLAPSRGFALRRNRDLKYAFSLAAEEIVSLRRLVKCHAVRKQRVQIDPGVLDKSEEALHAHASRRA